MNTFLSGLLVFGFCSSIHLHGADMWREKPMLAHLKVSANTTMHEYELWAVGWRLKQRRSTTIDRSINMMAETTFFAIQMALEQHPNPEFLEQCLLFLGTKVPPEFDVLWRPRFLEMDYLDKSVSKKVNDMLATKHLPTLEDRALGRK